VLVSTEIQSHATPIREVRYRTPAELEDYHWGIAGIEAVLEYFPVGEKVRTGGIIVGQVIDLEEAPGSWTVGLAEIKFSSIINTTTLSGVTTGYIKIFNTSEDLILTGILEGVFTLASFLPTVPPTVVTKEELEGDFTGTLIDGGNQVEGDIAVTHFLRALGAPLPDGYYTGVDVDVEARLFQLLFDAPESPTALYDELLLRAATLSGLPVGTISALAKPLGDETFYSTPIPEPTTMYLMGFGILGILGIVIRQRRKEKYR
jgi:hypothetical protein